MHRNSRPASKLGFAKVPTCISNPRSGSQVQASSPRGVLAELASSGSLSSVRIKTVVRYTESCSVCIMIRFKVSQCGSLNFDQDV